MTRQHLSLTLAQLAASVDVAELTQEVRDVTMRCILDLIGCAVAGYNLPGPVAVRRAFREIDGRGGHAIWLGSDHVPALAALLANAAAASALDLDDGNRAARGHPGAAVIPSVLTLADRSSTDAMDIMSAIVAGYEVGVRVAAAQRSDAILSRQTGRWAAMAVAAAIGRLLKLPPEPPSQALAIAGVLSPNMRANGSSGYSALSGNLIKEGIPFAAVTGWQAVLLARAGLTGPLDIFDHPAIFDPALLTQALGQDWMILDTYFKRYSCCRYIHPALDAWNDLKRAHGLVAQTVMTIGVHTFGWALKLSNQTDPADLIGLQFSLPYCLAVAAILGGRCPSARQADAAQQETLQRDGPEDHPVSRPGCRCCLSSPHACAASRKDNDRCLHVGLDRPAW
ncbi:MmgE/PrpD family protein [Rhizobium halophytocola]|uniref:2-methylcitrate dehydratase PrpD n=1 Tax=Rhizobium halophytocola TaxID=735519 RepID=A0ABS4E4I4_9HYPH|nr:MmgE/PrpD family protein [Rhizobium halophytocola]MBP1852816.1 2-methylcitrate dehydratase PrpD [Rhizobium halophytocola]